MTIPLGTILAFYGRATEVPADYLLCDGSKVLVSEYPELHKHLRKVQKRGQETLLPDLRGEFLRGLDLGRGIDGKRTLGSVQGHALGAHAHVIPYHMQVNVRPPGRGSFRSGSGNSDDNVPNPSTKLYGATETRPRNVAINFIIRARPEGAASPAPEPRKPPTRPSPRRKV